MKLSIVILAAGQGKRMKSDLPKVLQPLAGKPLLAHVIDTARTLAPTSMHVVYGHGGERVRATLAETLAAAAPVTSWALQAEQLGTGHAVQQALPALADDELALVLYGDVPLVRAETLRQLIASASDPAQGEAMGLLTVMLDDPTGYGRILRDPQGRVQAIVEQKDASEDQIAISEVNAGVYIFDAEHLRTALSRVTLENAQKEKYLTDVAALMLEQGQK